MSLWRRALVMSAIVMALSPCALSLVAQSEPVEWDRADGVGDADRTAILKLARRLGIESARRITFGNYLPSGCAFVRVESAVTVDGNRRTWREVLLRRRDWPECRRVARFSRRSEGRWIGSKTELSTEESWRVADGNWFVDMRLGPGVPYADAERIVLAIRHHVLVNRLPSSVGPLKLDTTMPAINANDIQSIVRSSSAPGRYEVRTGAASGTLLHVMVRDGQVELHGQSVWMVRFENLSNRVLVG
jgi:hypothetical protein